MERYCKDKNMTDYKIVLGVVATILGFVGYVPYFRDIFRVKTRPHVFSWFVKHVCVKLG